MNEIFFADCSELNNDELFNKYYKKVLPFRKEKIDRLKFREDKNLSLGASFLLNYGLEKCKINTDDISLQENENGKPFILNKSIFFNISHSKDIAMVVFSEFEVGCDIERIGKFSYKTAKKILTEKEFNLFFSHNLKEQKYIFYKYWTIYESFAKATSQGLKKKLNSFEIDFNNNEIDSDGEKYYFQEIDLVDDYSCAVCSKRKTKFDIEKINF